MPRYMIKLYGYMTHLIQWYEKRREQKDEQVKIACGF